MLVATEYLDRHNLTGNTIHQNLAYICNRLSSGKPYFKYIPTSVLEFDSRLHWSRLIITDKPVATKRPQITSRQNMKSNTFHRYCPFSRPKCFH